MNRSVLDPERAIVRIRRKDGTEKLLQVDGEQWQRLIGIANGEFGDPSIDLGGPDLPEEK